MKTNVWAGMYGSYFNGPFTTVTICHSGTTTCETISGILVDTGSFGLRIFGQVNHLALATETASNGKSIAECVPFGTISTWGRVAYADVQLGGEPVISKVPIQIINPNYSVMPAVCKNGPPVAQSPAQVGYNGILGVGCGGRLRRRLRELGPENPVNVFSVLGRRLRSHAGGGLRTGAESGRAAAHRQQRRGDEAADDSVHGHVLGHGQSRARDQHAPQQPTGRSICLQGRPSRQYRHHLQQRHDGRFYRQRLQRAVLRQRSDPAMRSRRWRRASTVRRTCWCRAR